MSCAPALERHRQHAQLKLVLQCLHAQRRNRADAGRRIGHLSGIAAHMSDHVVERLPRPIGTDRKNADIHRVVAEEREVVEGERDLRAEHMRDREDRIDALSDRVAVGLGRRHALHPHRTARARPIDQRDGAAERSSEPGLDHAHRRIDRPARRSRHDHLHGTRRKALLRGHLDDERQECKGSTTQTTRYPFHQHLLPGGSLSLHRSVPRALLCARPMSARQHAHSCRGKFRTSRRGSKLLKSS